MVLIMVFKHLNDMKHHSSFDCDYDNKQNEHIVFYEKPVLGNDNEQ